MRFDSEYEKKWGKQPKVAVDAVVLSGMAVLLIKRKDGSFALPGGFLNPKETLLEAIIRETKQETTLSLKPYQLVHREIFDNPYRDKRSHILTMAHLFSIYVPGRHNPKVKGGDDAIGAFWHPLKHCNFPMYADHAEIIQKMVYRHV